MNDTQYGGWLRHTRNRLGITQRDIQVRAGIGTTHLSRIENGGIALPEKETRDRIHAVLGTSDDDLVEAGILLRTTGLDGMPVYRGLDEVMAMPDSPSVVAVAPGTYDVLPRLLARVESWRPERRQRLFELIEDMDLAEFVERERS